MKILLGLGNPGKKYKNSRHNIGFKVTKKIAGRHDLRPEKRLDSLLAEGEIGGERIIIAQPLNLMNRSGRSAKKIADFYGLKPEDFLVIHDDLDLESGRIKLKMGGSSGGHNGVRSVVRSLESRDFCRLRLGIGRPPAGVSAADYVLTTFSVEEKKEVIEPAVKRAVDAAEFWCEEGCEMAMNRFN